MILSVVSSSPFILVFYFQKVLPLELEIEAVVGRLKIYSSFLVIFHTHHLFPRDLIHYESDEVRIRAEVWGFFCICLDGRFYGALAYFQILYFWR